jgi:hypothetical protein
MKTTKKTSKRARVRLTVQCGDDLPRFFDIPLRAARAGKAEEYQKAITQAAAAFSQTFNAELMRRKIGVTNGKSKGKLQRSSRSWRGCRVVRLADKS